MEQRGFFLENMESFWKQVKCQIKKTLPEHSYRMWIEPVDLLDHDKHHIKLSSPNSFFIKRLKDKESKDTTENSMKDEYSFSAF